MQVVTYSYRRVDVGEYRIVYDLPEDMVRVLLIGKRNDDAVYKWRCKMSSESMLSETDHENVDIFLGVVLDDYKEGKKTKVEAIAEIAHVVSAIDINNRQELDSYIRNY